MDDVLASLAGALREEARAENERRTVVLAGDADATRSAAETILDAAGVPRSETTVVGPADVLDCERHDQRQAGGLLGRTRTAVVLDATEGLRPNALGQSAGAVDGGGLFVLLVPNLEVWPEREDAFAASLAVPPYGESAVSGRFRARVVSTLRSHPGVAIVDCEAGQVERDGLTDPAPRCGDGNEASATVAAPEYSTFPAAYEACLTGDQADAVAALEGLRVPGTAVVVESDRGRGKSSAAGLAAASLAMEGGDVLVTAPRYRGAAEVFQRATELLESVDALEDRDRSDAPHRLETATGRVRFERPVDAADLPDDPDAVVVDEAAGLPVRLLTATLDAPAVTCRATTTTLAAPVNSSSKSGSCVPGGGFSSTVSISVTPTRSIPMSCASRLTSSLVTSSTSISNPELMCLHRPVSRSRLHPLSFQSGERSRRPVPGALRGTV